MSENIWSYRADAGHTPDADLTGYRVEATDGPIGKVDKHSDDVDAQYIVVDTGAWIFGRTVLLPAGTITAVDIEARTVQVARTKEQIKDAPEFDKHLHLHDDGYHDRISSHYSSHLSDTPGGPGAGPLGLGRPMS